MQICVIGTGYVGLVTGTCFAEAGNQVICVDVDGAKIDRLNRGEVPIFEPGLKPLVAENREDGRLKFTTHLSEGINNSEICFIAVGTPPLEDGSADLKHVLDVAEGIATVANRKVIVGTKSTVPVGTGDRIEQIFREKMKVPFAVFSNPEFLKEGDAVNDFMKPDRIIVGINDSSIEPILRELYAPFMRQNDRFIVMNRRSAELTKYAANAMLATRISFMNELANLCEAHSANINDIRRGMGSDPRIGPAFLYPGMGYGGSCFPKDVKALLKTGHEAGVSLEVVEAVEKANQNQKGKLFEKIVRHYGNKEKLKGLKMALWGLAFKARTDDIRESPALALIDQLLEAETKLAVFDPEAMENIKRLHGNRLEFKKNAYECLEGVDCLIVATEWNEFRSPDYGRMQNLMKEKVIFDGRNLLNAGQLKGLGFVYYGVGIG